MNARTIPFARASAAVAVMAAILRPASLEAHLTTTGLGPVYDGVSHFVVTPEDVLSVAVLALLAGLNGRTAGRRAIFAVSLAWLLGGIAAAAKGAAMVPPVLTAVSLLAIGALVALDRRLSPQVVAVLAVAVGLIHGLANGADMASTGFDSLVLVGVVTAAFVITAFGSAVVVSRQSPASRIAVRVAGSWAAAIGLLMLGWALRSAASQVG